MKNVPCCGPSNPHSDDAQEPAGDVKEPPLPQTEGLEEKFPRRGGIESGVEDGARVG
jgi:hypothetical protein